MANNHPSPCIILCNNLVYVVNIIYLYYCHNQYKRIQCLEIYAVCVLKMTYLLHSIHLRSLGTDPCIFKVTLEWPFCWVTVTTTLTESNILPRREAIRENRKEAKKSRQTLNRVMFWLIRLFQTGIIRKSLLENKSEKKFIKTDFFKKLTKSLGNN